MFKKILIANRGEIAVRIINACREMSIPAVAIYSTVDRSSLHVKLADEAVHIGPAPPLESYLNIDRIIQVALDTGAEAIHPGYGFLAENAQFARRCENAGLTFIGSGSESIRLLGNKIESRETMSKSRIPLIPGMMATGKDADSIREEALKIGFPVLVKAVAGGGGKGMRIVKDKKDFGDSLQAAMREAHSAFGDETVYVEKYIENPRHIEFQILADRHGNVIHLFERECSIQRRHQKIIEETPSVALDPGLRKRMGETAVRAVKAAHYTNAGTVEFLMDQEKRYYFLEVNTRIQVEHPITEFTTGVDLVKWQIRIAAGEQLTLKQEALSQRGHSIECRIYAEDPERNFLPSPGKVLFMKEPSGPGIRNDCGIYTGFEVPMEYDPILSKLVVWAEDRESAIRKMIFALRDYTILGIKTPIPMLIDILSHKEFGEGRTYTNFIERHFPDWKPGVNDRYIDEALITAAIQAMNKKPASRRVAEGAQSVSLWETIGSWELGRSH
jgi:acetyl-CoA carboxylase biotin carboxylase subunit